MIFINFHNSFLDMQYSRCKILDNVCLYKGKFFKFIHLIGTTEIIEVVYALKLSLSQKSRNLLVYEEESEFLSITFCINFL